MNLRKIREARGMKVSCLAAKMAVADTTITRWETGARVPDVKTALKLSQILHCTVDDLLNPTPPLPQAEQCFVYLSRIELYHAVFSESPA